VSEVAAAIREKRLELLSEVPRQLMRTDQRRLLQCVRSILDNAVKFTDMGNISVEARIVSCPGETPHGELVEITVSDTGIGIGEEDLSGMFQPFHRIVTFGRTITPGTRLGLFLTKKIATEILNGDLSVASEQGKGSRFSLRVPVRLA
jgi:signal transduction histidine kinase